MSVSHPQVVVVGLFLAYLVLVTVLWKVNHVDYRSIAESRDAILKGIVLPIGAGAALLAVVVTVLGAWHDAMVQDTSGVPGWVIVVPILFGLSALLNATSIRYRDLPRGALPMLALGTLLVGFSEEMVTRGVMLVGFREAGWSEVLVYLVSSILFALLHGVNVLFGQPRGETVRQILMALVAGTALYLVRMSTGTLVVGMLLHALWDFATLGITSSKGAQRPVAGLLGLSSFAVALVAVWFVV